MQQVALLRLCLGLNQEETNKNICNLQFNESNSKMCNIPKILYKYKTITDDDRNNQEKCFTKNIITKGELYFSKFSELNDPNEVLFDYSEGTKIRITEDELADEDYRYSLDTRENNTQGVILSVDGATAGLHVKKQLNPRHGVLCLTEDPKNSLMYSYYAGGHKGICIGFDWEKLGFQAPQKIEYRTERPTIDPRNPCNFHEAFITKYEKYKHEKELRFFSVPGVHKNSENVLLSISEIIFGCVMPRGDQEMVKDWAGQLKNISYYQAHVKPKSYEIFLKKI